MHSTQLALLRYEITIRCYGAVSTTFRRKAGWMRQPPTKTPPPALFAAKLLPELQPQPPALDAPRSREPPAPLPTTPQGEDDESLRNRKRTWAKLIRKVWLCDPELCSTCGQPMKIIAAITSPEQDDLIEKLLRHIARWDPPWKRVRKARAPPRSPVPQPDAPAPWPELIDPPHPDTDCVDPVFEDEQEA